MKSNDIKLSPYALAASFGRITASLKTYSGFTFFMVVAALYGFIVWRINVYSNIPADQSVSSTSASARPHIDPVVVQKLQTLKDNSVNVQTLFSQSRQNPFQE